MSKHTLAIYGNHLSELDQNEGLKKLGGQLLKTTHSSASYRLFELSDKQAVMCEDTKEGRQIRVELWELDADAILKILKELAPIYHLTTFNLSDESTNLAFLSSLDYCLAQNYKEVSRFGGWERYLLKTAEE